jgi:UPF0271 protein
MIDKYTVDLNCDMGESFGAWTMGNDGAVLPYVSSINIACGFHAGDPATMMRTLELASAYPVRIGAHPGFQDLSGFGRREIQTTPREVYELMVYQIGALTACAKTKGLAIHHVKPHGALYNMAARKRELADAIAQAVYDVDPGLILFGLSGSASIEAGKDKGLTVYSEVFADRTYQQDGTLTARANAQALIHDHKQASEQVVRMVKEGKVKSLQGPDVTLQVDTICLHGDNADAILFARQINEKLKAEGIEIR